MDQQQQEKDIRDYIIAIRKRKTAIFLIFLLILIPTILISVLLPPTYMSSSTILIEQQEIPQELVMSTVTSYAAERIQTIQARVMTRTNLMKIIEKFDLYVDERKLETTEEIVAKMREAVSLDIISANVVDPRTGRPSAAAIAFSLSYKGKSPGQVQRVANELTTLYLNENLTSRSQKATETSVFFKDEADRLAGQISDLEEKLADFKQKNADALPELKQINLNILQRNENSLYTLEATLRSLDEKKFYLNGQLAQLDPGNPAVPGSTERLKVLKAEYASAKSKYSDEHPDIIRLKSEIESLENEVGSTGSLDAITEQLKFMNGELSQKKKIYTSDHPDIVSLQNKINSLNAELDRKKAMPLEEKPELQPDNPLYITIETQLASVNSEIKSIKQQRDNLLQEISKLEESLYKAPQVEREYLNLKRDYDNAVAQYRNTKAKQMQADVAKQLEAESKGEKFTLIEPAALPEKPISPNRSAILFLGFVLALGSGFGYAIVLDAISGTVRGSRSVQRTVGVLPLSVIPYELNLEDRAKSQKIKKSIFLFIIAIIIIGVIFVHFFISPLDVIWFRILRKAEILMA